MKPKILIVEDDPALRRALKTKLAGNNLEVLEAVNGEVGYQKIVEESPDVVLLDIEMPKMDGIEVLKKLKKNLIEANIIVLTNVEESETLATAMEYGVTTYIIKKDKSIDSILTEVQGKLNV